MLRMAGSFALELEGIGDACCEATTTGRLDAASGSVAFPPASVEEKRVDCRSDRVAALNVENIPRSRVRKS